MYSASIRHAGISTKEKQYYYNYYSGQGFHFLFQNPFGFGLFGNGAARDRGEPARPVPGQHPWINTRVNELNCLIHFIKMIMIDVAYIDDHYKRRPAMVTTVVKLKDKFIRSCFLFHRYYTGQVVVQDSVNVTFYLSE